MNEKVDFERMCNLKKNDVFLYSGCWRVVIKIAKGKLHFKSLTLVNYGETSSKSKMFVQVEINDL